MFQKPITESPAERARHYRTLAMTAESNAAETPLPALREVYLRSADRWHKLAALLEIGTGYTPKKIAPRTGVRHKQAEDRAPTPQPAGGEAKQSAAL